MQQLATVAAGATTPQRSSNKRSVDKKRSNIDRDSSRSISSRYASCKSIKYTSWTS